MYTNIKKSFVYSSLFEWYLTLRKTVNKFYGLPAKSFFFQNFSIFCTELTIYKNDDWWSYDMHQLREKIQTTENWHIAPLLMSNITDKDPADLLASLKLKENDQTTTVKKTDDAKKVEEGKKPEEKKELSLIHI